uniref:Casein kinase n=1 Tax=Solanum tuberosum TaxID=4113 RepID=M1ANK9_SOLTU
MLCHLLKDREGHQWDRIFGTGFLVLLEHFPGGMLLVLVGMGTTPETRLQMIYLHLKMCKLIQKEAVPREIAARPEGLQFQVADRALQVNLRRVAQAAD